MRSLLHPVSSEEAVQIAKQECERRGLAWGEPIGVGEFLGYYSIRTHDDSFGDNVVVKVGFDGKVLWVGR